MMVSNYIIDKNYVLKFKKNNYYFFLDRDISTQVCTNNIKTNLTEKPNGDNDIENIYTRGMFICIYTG